MLEGIFVTGFLVIGLAIIPHNLFPGFHLEPVSYSPPDFDSFYQESKGRWNHVLSDKADRLLLNKVVGPESMAQKDNLLYTGLADGRLVEINLDTLVVRHVTRFVSRDKTTGKFPDQSKCLEGDQSNLLVCGRPLGMRFMSDGSLVVADGIFGLFKVNVTTGSFASLTDDLPRGIYNDVILDPKDESIAYLSISSTKWLLDQVPWSLAEHENSGLLLRVNLNDGKVTPLLTGLYFGNGVEITADQSYLLVSQCSDYSILKVSLSEARVAKDSSKVSRQYFASNLPAEPDNIRLFNGNIYVGFAIARAKGGTAGDAMSGLPLVRKAVGRFCFIISRILDFVATSNLWPHEAVREFAWTFYSGHVMYNSLPPAAAVGVLDGKTGSLKGILGSETFAFISEAILDERNGDIYFGSFKNKFLGRIKAKDVIFS